MILDSSLEFCDAEAVYASTGTEVIAAAIDLAVAGVKLGVGQPTLYLVINVSTAFTSGTSSTVQFQLVSDSSDPAAGNGTETVHWASKIFTDAQLTKGTQIVVPLPSGAPAYERYLQLQVVTGGAATTAGSINAFLTLEAPTWYAFTEADS